MNELHISSETALFILDRALDRELARRRARRALSDYVSALADKYENEGRRPRLKVVI